jgi:hypothetical protein
MERLRKAIQFFRRFGFKALILRLVAEIKRFAPDPYHLEEVEQTHNVGKIISNRFMTCRPLVGFSAEIDSPRRINLVTDSINSGSLFGGVATSIILSTLLAQKMSCELRILTRTENPKKKNYDQIIEANNLSHPPKIEFRFASIFDAKSEIPVGANDLFLTTSWWTTWSVRETFGSKKIIYLLQEDERAFYPHGDDHLRCSELLKDPEITYIINSKLLYEHLISDGLNNLQDRGIWFEPAWPEHLFFSEPQPARQKMNFFFYARPNNVRNLFYRGLEAIEGAVFKGILKFDSWDFHFAGKDIPKIKIMGYPIKTYQNMNWSEYAALVRKMDLGLSLMYSPHPSYPPIDLAASGAIVVTNLFGNKQNLSQYSKNIICRNFDTESLISGLEDGVNLALDLKTRQENYRQQTILRDWRKSFKDVLFRLDELLPDVRN